MSEKVKISGIELTLSEPADVDMKKKQEDVLSIVSNEPEALKKLLKKAISEGFWSKLILIRSSTIHDATLANFANIQQQDYARIETEAGELLFVHGNKIGIDPNDVVKTNEEGATIVAKGKLIAKSKLTGKARSWLPKITKETHLVIGHLHKRFFNERYRVYGLGHWTKKGKKFDKKCYLIIDSSNTLNELQLQSY